MGELPIKAFLLFFIIISLQNSLVISAPIENSVALLLEEEISKIPKELFSDDALLIQSVDSSTPKTTYSCSQTHDVIFVRPNEDDSGKKVIVLKEDEDNIPSCNNDKRTFVVLVKNSDGYNAILAYMRERVSTDVAEDLVVISGQQYRIEWDSWIRRESQNNKAQIFGWTTCSYSNFVPCKDSELNPVVHVNSENRIPKRDIYSDFMCDIALTNLEANFFGGTISALNTAVTILNGADMIYKDEMGFLKEITKNLDSVIKSNTQNGRAFGLTLKNLELLSNISEIGAENVIENGKNAISTGVLMFVVLGGAIGQLALSLSPNVPIKIDGLETLEANTVEENENVTESLKEAKSDISSYLGRKLMAGLTDKNSKYIAGVNPDPTVLLNMQVARRLAIGSNQDSLGRSLGRSYGNEGTRIYNADIQPDGSKTGSITADVWNAGTKNLNQEYGKKSTGQVFAENLKLGWHFPLGAVEDAANQLGHLLGVQGKVSDDRSAIDDLLDKTTTALASATGPIVDAAADILAPLGLGKLAHAAANIASGALGIVGGGISQVVLGPYNLVKTGLKALGLGGLIGMKGSKSRVHKAGGIINTDAGGPTQEEMDAFTSARGSGTGAKIVGHGYVGEGLLVDANHKVESGKGPPQFSYNQGNPQGYSGQYAPGNPQGYAPAYSQGNPQGSPSYQGNPQDMGMPQGNPQGYAPAYGQGYSPEGYPPGGYQGGQPFMAGRGITIDSKPVDAAQSAEPNIPIALVTDVDLFSQFGWRSVDITIKDLSSTNTSDSQFTGFGFCPQKSVSAESLNNPELLINFYLNLMRTDCLKNQKKQLEDLFGTAGLLRLEPDKTIGVVSESPLLKKKKLSNSEIGQISKAYEISALSEVLQKSVNLKNPSGDKITINIGVMQSMTMEYLENVLKTCPTHSVKLIRNYAITLKTVLVKVMQDFYRYNTCHKCSSEQIGDADYDALTNLGLLEFIVGSWTEYTTTKDNEASSILQIYNSWFTKVRTTLIEKLALFVF